MYGGSNPPGTSEESLEVVCNERFEAFFVLSVRNPRRVVGRFAVAHPINQGENSLIL